MKVINSDKAPKAFGPYSQAISANGFIFCAGQVGFNRETDSFETGIENQTHRIMKNFKEVLSEAGSDFEHVVKSTIFLLDKKDFAVVNKIYGSYFVDNKPARSTVEVSGFPNAALIEIELIAVAK